MSGGGPEDDPFPAWLADVIVICTILAVFASTVYVLFFEGGGHH